MRRLLEGGAYLETQNLGAALIRGNTVIILLFVLINR